MLDWKILKIAVALILVTFIFFNVGDTVWQQKDKYFSCGYWQGFHSLQKAYLSSQYVNKHPEGWIPDETINAYAGGAYIRGGNPILIAPDTPPLGRYLIGLSAIIFNNENTIILIAGVCSLFLLYLLGLQVFSSKLLALLPPFFLSFEPIFKNQLVYTPLLDIFQLLFLLTSFYFFNKGLLSKKGNLFLFALASILLGFFISTKFFITGITVALAFCLIVLIHKDWKKLQLLIFSLPLSVLVLLTSYIRTLFFGYTLRDLVGIQKWVFLYHESQLILPFSIWPLLLFNKWYVWFGNEPVISDSQWLISWPVVTILSFATIIFYLFKKMKQVKTVEVLMIWSVLYILFFSFGQITSRYFVILIPILYITSVFGIVSSIKTLKK